jgi:hypothetical protein
VHHICLAHRCRFSAPRVPRAHRGQPTHAHALLQLSARAWESDQSWARTASSVCSSNAASTFGRGNMPTTTTTIMMIGETLTQSPPMYAKGQSADEHNKAGWPRWKHAHVEATKPGFRAAGPATDPPAPGVSSAGDGWSSHMRPPRCTCISRHDRSSDASPRTILYIAGGQLESACIV